MVAADPRPGQCGSAAWPEQPRRGFHPAALQALPFFRTFRPAELREFVAPLRAYDFARGQLVYAAGEPAHNCLVVVRGALALNFSTPQGLSVFSLLGPGGIAGDLALIDGGPQPLACVAREATIAFEVDRIGYELLLRGGSVVALRFFEAVTSGVVGILRKASAHMARIAPERASGRADLAGFRTFARGDLMCRVLMYQGEAVSLDDLLFKPNNSLVRQTYNPQMLDMLSLAGFGMLGWDETSHRPEVPFSYRSVNLPLFDPNLKDLAEKLRVSTLIAHVRGVMADDNPTVGQQTCIRFATAAAGWRWRTTAFWPTLAACVSPCSRTSSRRSPGTSKAIPTPSGSMRWCCRSCAIRGQRSTPDEIVDAVERAFAVLREVRRDHDIALSSPVNLFISDGSSLVAVASPSTTAATTSRRRRKSATAAICISAPGTRSGSPMGCTTASGR